MITEIYLGFTGKRRFINLRPDRPTFCTTLLRVSHNLASYTKAVAMNAFIPPEKVSEAQSHGT